MRPFVPAAVLVLAAFAAPACSSASRYAGMPGRATVVFEPLRATDADRARAKLQSLGWAVGAAPAGVARRTRSSVAAYAQRKRPGRGLDLADALRPLVGDVDVLPFLGDGPGGNDAVVWLADADAASAPARE